MSGSLEPPSEHTMDVSVFVHAASSVSVGPGGYGIVILRSDGQFQLSGHVSSTEKRTLELQSVVEALNAVYEPAKVRLSCNSSYIARASTQRWIESWQRAKFKTAAGEWIKNHRLWIELAAALDRHNEILWMRVRHSVGSQYHDLAQSLARGAMAGHIVPLSHLGSTERRPLNITSRSVSL